MLYVSGIHNRGIRDRDYEITDSETGRVSIVSAHTATVSGDIKYSCDGKIFSMSEVVGYFSYGAVYIVDKHLVRLLEYVEDIGIDFKASDNCIRVSNFPIVDQSRHKILIEIGSTNRVMTVLDVIMAMSKDSGFYNMLEKGILVAHFGLSQYYTIHLCGDYMGHIAKLMIFAREG